MMARDAAKDAISDELMISDSQSQRSQQQDQDVHPSPSAWLLILCVSLV